MGDRSRNNWLGQVVGDGDKVCGGGGGAEEETKECEKHRPTRPVRVILSTLRERGVLLPNTLVSTFLRLWFPIN